MFLASLLRNRTSGGCGATRFCGRLLKERYQTAELPYPPEALRAEILRVFADLTGEQPRRASGTMWDGLPKPCWHVHRVGKRRLWLDKAIPLLMERLERANRWTDGGAEEVRR